MNFNYLMGRMVQPVVPVSVEVFYEDKRPYIKYVGTTELDNGMKIQIEIPKMDLVLKELVREEETYEAIWHNQPYKKVTVSQNIYVKHDQLFNIVPIERTCTKKDLEKELGYKLNIKG